MIPPLPLRRAILGAAALLGLLAAFAAPAWSRPAATTTIQSGTKPYLAIDPVEIVNYAITYTTEPNRWTNSDGCYYDPPFACRDDITRIEDEATWNNDKQLWTPFTLDGPHFTACAINAGFEERNKDPKKPYFTTHLCGHNASLYWSYQTLLNGLQGYWREIPYGEALPGDILVYGTLSPMDLCWGGVVLDPPNAQGRIRFAAHSVSDNNFLADNQPLDMCQQGRNVPPIILRLNADPQPPQVGVPAVVQERDYLVGQQVAVVWSATDPDEPDAAPVARAASGVRRIEVLREGVGAPVTLAGDAGSFAFDAGMCTSTTLTITAFDGAENSASQVVTVIVHQYGDLDRSGRVDVSDIAALESQLGQPPGAATAHYDLDGDGGLTEDDLLLLERQLGASCATPEPNPYPYP